MDSFDQTREGQIWQRVRSSQPPTSGEGLRGLRRESLALAGVYQQLSSSLAGKAREKAGMLYRQELETAAALRGLEVILGEDGGKRKPIQPPGEPVVRLLKHCYHRTRNACGEYRARSVEAETGAVFRVLADRAEQQCVLLAELLGML